MSTPHDDPLPRLPARDARGHKGSFGTVGVVGGCALADSRMIGGPALAAIGALRAGCGLAKLAMPEGVLNAALTIAPSATGVALPTEDSGAIVPHEGARAFDALLRASDCVAIGPGMGAGEGVRALAFRAINQDDRPVVVDADAINALAELPEFHRDFRAMAALTPHPGEFRRLSQALGLDLDPIHPGTRADAAATLARTLGCVVVLKGAATVVSDGVRLWVSDAQNPALATAGTGDVLTGVVASFIAQFHKRPIVAGERTVTSEARGGLSLFDCARLAVAAHARAGALWVESRGATGGMLASELADALPRAVEALRAG
ncbi:MAG: NAD(P)H-hydrate dehydratase [Phycisphaeraceae bacterium]|nr:NAD(P)H-hydrate dehydratase [Phycisphaeraceae bacterium]